MGAPAACCSVCSVVYVVRQMRRRRRWGSGDSDRKIAVSIYLSHFRFRGNGRRRVVNAKNAMEVSAHLNYPSPPIIVVWANLLFESILDGRQEFGLCGEKKGEGDECQRGRRVLSTFEEGKKRNSHPLLPYYTILLLRIRVKTPGSCMHI